MDRPPIPAFTGDSRKPTVDLSAARLVRLDELYQKKPFDLIHYNDNLWTEAVKIKQDLNSHFPDQTQLTPADVIFELRMLQHGPGQGWTQVMIDKLRERDCRVMLVNYHTGYLYRLGLCASKMDPVEVYRMVQQIRLAEPLGLGPHISSLQTLLLRLRVEKKSVDEITDVIMKDYSLPEEVKAGVKTEMVRRLWQIERGPRELDEKELGKVEEAYDSEYKATKTEQT